MIDQGKDTLDVRLLRAALMFIMRLLFRIEYLGLERVPKSGPLLIVANHVTYFDPFWITTPIRRTVRFMAWDRIFAQRLSSALFRWLGAFPVNLDNPKFGAYKTALQVLKRGEVLMIFPEGGRSPDGSLQPFKEGAAYLALRTGATILPVVVHGGRNVWSTQMTLPRPSKVRVEFLDPITKDDFDTGAAELTDRVRSVILEHQRRDAQC